MYMQNEQVLRYKGKPGVTIIPIGKETLNDFENCFILYISSGTGSIGTVSSAIVKLDGIILLNTSDFSNTSDIYDFEICYISGNSILEVEVMGEPGSYLDIWIEGKLKNPSIGDYYGGGIVSYIFQPGDPGYVEGETHGFIIAPYDQGYYPWGCGGGQDYQGGLKIGTSCDPHTGPQNTDLIVENCLEETAAKICKDLVLNGYDDWYLPTNQELAFAYNNLYLNGLGNFSTTDVIKFYWSCQEFCGGGYENTHAHGYVFGDWYQDNSWKTYSLKVRAAREF